MKTTLKLSLFLLTAIAVVAVSCKGKSGSSSSVPATNSTSAVSAKGNSVMDSLNITDPDVKKICALYDDAITDYIVNMKTLTTDTSAAARQKIEDLNKKWKEKDEAIKPQVEAMRRKVAMNPGEALKFAQFSAYEAKRMMAVMLPYEQSLLKNMPGAASGK